MNPSSDTNRFGGGLEDENEVLRHSSAHEPLYLNTNSSDQGQLNDHSQILNRNHNPDKSSSQCLLPSQPHLEPENELQAHISNPDAPGTSLDHEPTNSQHGNASSPPQFHQYPQSHLENVFRGSDLVDWLVERGLSAGRAEAQLYGARLQRGGVLTGQHSFKDEPNFLYHFTQPRRAEE